MDENLSQNIFDFASKPPELIDYEKISKIINSTNYTHQIKFIQMISNTLKDAIFTITNNNYYNNHNFVDKTTTENQYTYLNSDYQIFLKKVFKSKIPKIALNLISNNENNDVPILLEFFSLSSFIFSQSSQLTYLAPTIIKIASSLLGQSKDMFLLLNNNSNSLINHVDWRAITEQLKKVKVTKGIYIEILKILSAYITITYPIYQQNDEDVSNSKEVSLSSIYFFGISNSNAVCLIETILQSEFAKDFLETLHKIVTTNIIQAIKLFKSGAILVLLDSISSLFDNKYFQPNDLSLLREIILKIAVYIITFICDKETCQKFLKVFYTLETNQTEFIELFKHSLTANSLSTSNFFHFNSTNGLFFLPPLPLSYFDTGVTFVTELLIPSFGEISPSFFSYHNSIENDDEMIEDELFELPIFYVASENSKSGEYNYLVISLFRNKISFSSNIYESKVDIYLDIPTNEWFTLSVSIKKWKQIKVQIIESQRSKSQNEKSQQIIRTREIEANMIVQWSIPIHRIEMFNISFFSPSDVIKQFKSQRKIEGLIRRVMLFTGNFQFASNDQSDQQSIVCRNQQLFGHFTPQFCSLPESRLANMIQNSPVSSILMINTEPIPMNNEQFVCPFGDFFLKFNGLIEIVLYFSKSGLKEEEIIMLFELLLFLFDKYPSLQKEMHEINGYHLIAHFLNTRQSIEVNELFFNEICKVEEKTTNASLLSQFRNNLILNFPKYLDCDDNELLFKLLKKWQEYDTNFFRSHVSFSKFCHILFHQFADRKGQINLSIKKTLMSILVLNSQYLEKQDLYLLTQLTGKLAEHDLDTSVLLIKEIYGITKDHPEKLDTIQRGLIEIKNKPPELLCTIVKLFDTDDEYTKRLLYTEMSEKRSTELKNEFVLFFFNFLFNTHKRLSFDELIQITDFHIVSVNLLLFILSFGFECDESCVSSIVSLFNNIFLKKPDSAQFISDSIGMNSITLFVFISFAIFKSHSIMNIVMSLIFCKVSLLADSLRIINVLSAYTRSDMSDYQSLILNTFILKIIDFSNDKDANFLRGSFDLNEAVDMIVNFFCFGPNRSIFDTTAILKNNGNKNATFSNEIEFSLVDFFKAYLEYPITIDQNEFGLFLNENGYWTDLKTVELLLTLVDADGLSEESYRKLMILFSFVINKYTQVPTQKVAEILDRVNTACQFCFYTYDNSKIVTNSNRSIPNFDALIPVFVSLHQNGYKSIPDNEDDRDDSDNNYLKIVHAFIDSIDLTIDLYDRYNTIMTDFFRGLHEISNVSERLLTGLTNESLIKEEKVTIDEAFSDVKQKEITLNIHREKIFRKHRPVYSTSSKYRRYNIFDEYFRPFMLTKKERLKFVQINSPVFNDNTLGSGEGSNETIIWSSPCQRIKIDQTFDGYFSVTNNGYRFITPKGKSYNLLKSSIRYVFWNYCNNEPLSFTIFLLNGKCFLFRFFKPETREKIIENLQLIDLENCHFFQQKKGYEEVGRLKLTQRWRERSISNFDYLMWLNLLSGRTFLDPDLYPIFPLIFTSSTDKTEMRDLSKNVIFISSDNISKWKSVRLTYDPYENFLLNQSFSTQKVVCAFLDGIEQFMQRESEDASQESHGQHHFYSSFDDVRSKNNRIDYRSTKEKYHLKNMTKSDNDNDGYLAANTELKAAKSCTLIDRKKTPIGGIFDYINANLIIVNKDMKKLNSFDGLIDGLRNSTVHTELIPEFFFLPEVFKTWKSNQEGEAAGSFPSWAPNASQFILEHTSAIESEEVSMNLHKWIDIVWGVRQNDYIYNPGLAFASHELNITVSKRTASELAEVEGHLPPMFFSGPHPARNTMPSFESTTTVIKLEMKKNKKNSLSINFKALVNEFFINNSKNNNNDTLTNDSTNNTNTASTNNNDNNETANVNDNNETANVNDNNETANSNDNNETNEYNIETANVNDNDGTTVDTANVNSNDENSGAICAENVEATDLQAAALHERSIAQMMKLDTVEPLSIGIVNMKKKNVHILFSNGKVVQLPGKDTIDLTDQVEESRINTLNNQSQSSANLPQNAALNATIHPNYGDPSSFCFSHTVLYFVPLGTHSIYCFDFAYNRLFTTVITASTSSLSYASNSPSSSHLGCVTCIDSADTFVVSGSKDTSVIAWSKDPKGITPFKLLLCHAKPVKIVKIVKRMKILLSVDIRGTLCISMFPFLRLIKDLDLGFVPSMVDMTRCCLIAFDGPRVASFTSNGEKIAERVFKGFAVVSEVAVEVASRSDVVLIATTNREVLLLNCVSLEIVGVLLKLESLAKLLKFDERSGTVAIVTESHDVIFTQIPD